MNKKLIALAVSGLLAAPAFAQSNVTIYGVADAYFGLVNGKQTTTGKSDTAAVVGSGLLSGSRLGFKGSEDLGNGLKAEFALEQGFNSDDGSSSSGRAFHRQAYVALSSSMGKVGLGRQYAPGYAATSTYEATGGAAIAPQVILAGAGFKIQPGSSQRIDNSITYASPNFGGLTINGIWGVGTEDATDEKAGRVLSIGANYANGPIGIAYVYNQQNSTTNGNDTQREHYLGGSYDLGMITLLASYQTLGGDTGAGGGLAAADAKLWELGGIVKVGAGNVHVGYGMLNSDAAKSDAKSLAIAYTQNLSKRTTAYAGINRTSNDDAVSYGLTGSNGLDRAGEAQTIYAVGVRHKF